MKRMEPCCPQVTLQETITWDPPKREVGKIIKTHKWPKRGMGYVIVARFGYVGMSIGNMWKSKGPHQPSGFLFNNDHFLREFVGFTSPEPGIPPSWWTANGHGKKMIWNDSDISLLRAYDPPDEQILGANPTKKWQCVYSLYTICMHHVNICIYTFQIDIYDWYAYNYTTLRCINKHIYTYRHCHAYPHYSSNKEAFWEDPFCNQHVTSFSAMV